MGFWRDYRKVVRSVNPDAYLVGEIWWLEWPDKLFDPEVYLEGDQFDAIMNYRWFRVARGFFGQAEPVLECNRIYERNNPDHKRYRHTESSGYDECVIYSRFSKAFNFILQ